MAKSVTVFLHPISARILMHEYGTPITIDARDHLYDHLQVVSRSTQPRTYKGIIYPVSVVMSRGEISDPDTYAGMYIYRLHKRQIFTHMLSAVLAGHTALGALNKFYDLYGISDDDFDRHNMYREWTRYYGRIKSRRAVTHTIHRHHTPAVSSALPRISPADVMAHLVARHFECFMTSGNIWNKFLYRQLEQYTMRHVSGLSTRDIAARYKVSRQLVEYNISRWQLLMKCDPHIHATWQSLTRRS